MSNVDQAAHDLHKETRSASVLRADIVALTDDEDAIRDTLEGATSLREAIAAVLISIEDDQAMVDGCTVRIGDLQTRRDRVEQRIETKRAMVERAMLVGGIRKIETPVGTVSLADKAPAAVIENEAAIPAEFFKVPEPRLDRTSVTRALRDGRSVPGARLDNGGVKLVLRRR